MVITAAGVNLFMALYLQWAARAPTDVSYPLGSEFEAIFAPLWRITVASIVAEVVSELVDGEVYHWFVRSVTTRYQWARVAVSNSVSIPIDNVIFAVGAFGAIPGFADHALTLPVDRGVGHLRREPHRQGARQRGEPPVDLPQPRSGLERRP